MEIRYMLLLNEQLDTEGRHLAWFRGYEKGDKLVFGFQGFQQLPDDCNPLAEKVQRNAAERIWKRFNIDHPEGYRNRSMCVGDVIIFHYDGDLIAWKAESIGFARVELDELSWDAGKEPSRPAVTEMHLCEIQHLVLHENQLYRFTAAPNCEACRAYVAQSKPCPCCGRTPCCGAACCKSSVA